MRQVLGVESVAVSYGDGLYGAMGFTHRDQACPELTDHCFTGDYPTPLIDRDGEQRTRQLSLLAEIA